MSFVVIILSSNFNSKLCCNYISFRWHYFLASCVRFYDGCSSDVIELPGWSNSYLYTGQLILFSQTDRSVNSISFTETSEYCGKKNYTTTFRRNPCFANIQAKSLANLYNFTSISYAGLVWHTINISSIPLCISHWRFFKLYGLLLANL